MSAVRHHVTLRAHTPDPERVIASAAAVCYAAEVARALDPEPARVGEFLSMLRRMGHLSPFEHASFTFYVEGVSRALTHQLVRHRLASYSQRSQRYVTHDSFDYVVPPRLSQATVSWEGREVDARAFFDDTMALLARRYAALNDGLGRSGQDSNEDARYLLPNACETKIVVTMNARELLHFFEERLCLRAQWEIREVADAMLSLVRPVAPRVFEGAGPKCVRLERCPEGKMGCGRLAEIRRKHAADR
jgi:thymidylate synthase (FAD)